jgi:hypothetical protein
LPFSLTTAAAIHVIVIALLALGVLGALILNPPSKKLPEFAGFVEGGPGDEGGPNTGPVPAPGQKEVEEKPGSAPSRPPTGPDVRFAPPLVQPETLPETPGSEVRPAEAKDAEKQLEKIREKARSRLLQGGSGKPGLGGRGKDGTQGGSGNRKGPTGNLDVHQRRAERWIMHFNTLDGHDYLRQLADLSLGMKEKTLVVMPQPGGGFLVFRDLNRQPPVGRVEDVSGIQGISWTDEKPESVASLSRALGLAFVPERFHVFFPNELERKLLELELKYRGKREEELKETHFQIVRRGGVYQPIVISQR